MLHLDEVRKTYHTGTFTQAALDGVTITFRDNEFVAVLGPSGSGKTTLLNIVGGLDHCDSGDLVIDQVSTSEYKDRDWDTYRNNRIGFVFQNYNLIPHQTVLANVELALTLSGVGAAERAQRAKQALQDVDLTEHMNKLPNQLSGGQMQRVAIARALINDPEILLADEPTGALDSKTGVQVMNLLQQIAANRLVIMVTHNPELAQQYATRIVSLRDGNVVDDTRPYTPLADRRQAKEARRTSMSFLTAIALSFTNLMTKKGRTLMTSFAGSIGIIGIATILALANGINAYIRSVEEDTLSLYPLTIQTQGIDLTSLLTGSNSSPDDSSSSTSGGEVHEVKTLAKMFSHVGSNDLASLKTYLDSDSSGISQYVNSIQYNYNVTPQIFSTDTNESVRQVNPNAVFSALGMNTTSSSSLLSMGMSANVFSSLPDDMGLVNGQYDVLAGHWPTNSNECMLVLSSSGGVSDFVLYAMGLRNPDQLEQMVTNMAQNKPITTPTDTLSFTYDELMAVKFSVVPAQDFYQYDPTYQVWTDKSTDQTWMKNAVANGEPLKVAGVARPDPSSTTTMLSPGLYYPSSLVTHLMSEGAASPIVKQQLATPDVNVLSGKTFAEEQANPSLSSFDFSSLLNVDPDAMAQLFSANLNNFSPSLPSMNLSSLASSMPAVPPPDLTSLMSGLNVSVSPNALGSLISQTLADYLNDTVGTLPSPSASGSSPPATSPPASTSAPTGSSSGTTGPPSSSTPSSLTSTASSAMPSPGTAPSSSAPLLFGAPSSAMTPTATPTSSVSPGSSTTPTSLTTPTGLPTSTSSPSSSATTTTSTPLPSTVTPTQSPTTTPTAGSSVTTTPDPSSAASSSPSAGTVTPTISAAPSSSPSTTTTATIGASSTPLPSMAITLFGSPPSSTPTPSASAPTSTPTTPASPAAPASSPASLPTTLTMSLPPTVTLTLPTGLPTPVSSFLSTLPTQSLSLPASLSVSLPSLPVTLPTSLPTSLPSGLPTALPSLPITLPTSLPTTLPTSLPTSLPTDVTIPWPSGLPTTLPSDLPSALSSLINTLPTLPGLLPTTPEPSQPTAMPTSMPTDLGSIPGVSQVVDSFTTWFSQPSVQAQFSSRLAATMDSGAIQQQLAGALASYMQQTLQSTLTAVMSSLQSQLAVAMQSTMSQLTSQLSSAMNIDPAQLSNVFHFNMDSDQLTTLLMSMRSNQANSLDSNLTQFGYADPSVPYSIDIYPKDFTSKQHVIDILDGYNNRMSATGQDGKVITYTDMVGTLMSSVTDIISKITSVLVAFVSISLVVSSIMIGVITYISVLERRKEIGILRALGASKRDIGNVFNAETLIVGFVAGAMGVVITLILTLIANPIVYHYTQVKNIAQLPAIAGVALIAISMALTFVAGLIPSSAASRRDPVEALRSE
ncbi:MAG: ATP-binding cassette domain-containing protein [Propionibacteriaceae bacterium]|nr:ATP-binding cassette domain-containing protein [Propionibacteriaceae bacterium]